ncbi:ABC transporter ATP-binding protein [Maritalea sp.]|uniref:ABC transporter ATP-binding protein n=1 Tax=Maritalea sp. TaxID=2003361 RepID=UPI003EF3C2EA
MLDVENVSLRFGGVKALTDISFHVNENEIFSLIGPNGAGKTSMLNCISGRYRPQEGNITYNGKNLLKRSINDRAAIGIGRTFQNLALFSHMSVIDNILVGQHHLLKNNFVSGMFYWVGGAQKEEANARREIEDIVDFLEIQHVRNEPAGSLSYGLRKRVELARAIAIKPKLILLDEPMAGMNLEEKEDMARYIIELNEQYGITVVMIEHDMGVVVDISHRVAVLDFGQKIAEGSPEEVVEDEHVKTAYLGVDDFNFDEEEAV